LTSYFFRASVTPLLLNGDAVKVIVHDFGATL